MAQSTKTKAPAARRIASVLGSMPYGALASDRAGLGFARRVVGEDARRAEKVNLDVLADYLEALRGVLEGVAEGERKKDARLREVESQLDAVGRVLARGLPAKLRNAVAVQEGE